jgi:CheY-like chemotaxis protein
MQLITTEPLPQQYLCRLDKPDIVMTLKNLLDAIHKAFRYAGLPLVTLKAPLKHEECPSERKNKILVVDDNSDLRKMLMLSLKESGYNVFEAATGFEALKQARTTSPDLILMDLGMPVVNGDEAMVWLKADPLTRHIPVIVTTAFLFGPCVDRAIATGAAEVMYKPFDLKSLHTVLQRHLSLQPQTHGMPQT